MSTDTLQWTLIGLEAAVVLFVLVMIVIVSVKTPFII